MQFGVRQGLMVTTVVFVKMVNLLTISSTQVVMSDLNATTRLVLRGSSGSGSSTAMAYPKNCVLRTMLQWKVSSSLT